MASKIYFCVCEDWSERIFVSSFGGANRTEEKRYAASMYKVCHSIHTDHDKAQNAATALRHQIASNRAAQAPQVGFTLSPEESRIVHRPDASPPLDVIDPEQTMTAEEIRAAIKAGMDAERDAQK